MLSIKTVLFLFFIFILSFFIRFIGQPDYPACLHRDEVQWAYNSYSIAQTAKDEWGVFMPLHFKYNGEYHVPLVMYLPAIVFKLFNPSDVGFRIPFIIMGALIPIIGFWFSFLIFKDKKLSVIFAALLAINPWEIMNSRASGELSILSLFFGISGFCFLFKFLHKSQTKNLIFASIFFIATYFSYIASRFDIPLLLLLFTVVYWKKLPKPKITLPIFAFLVILPYLMVALHPQRFNGTNIIGKHLELAAKEIKVDSTTKDKLKIYYQAGKDTTFEFIDNYFDYLSPYYIFRNMGEYDRTNLADSGSLYTFEFIFVLVGLLSFLTISDKKLKTFFIGWILLTPIVGALTYNYPDRPNSSRTVYFYFILSLLSAYGLWAIIRWLKNQKIKWLIYIAILIIATMNIAYVWSNFYKYGNQAMAKARGCGYQELFNYTENVKNNYNNIFVGTLYDYPYVQFLWYTKYNPNLYHDFLKTTPPEKSVVLIQQQNPHDWSLDKYTYAHNSCLMQTDPNNLYIGNFNDCKEKYGIRVKRDNKNKMIIFLLPDKRANGKNYIVYKDENTIRRTDNFIAFNLYSYQTEYENIIYSDKELEAMEYVD